MTKIALAYQNLAQEVPYSLKDAMVDGQIKNYITR